MYTYELVCGRHAVYLCHEWYEYQVAKDEELITVHCITVHYITLQYITVYFLIYPRDKLKHNIQ